MTLTAARDRTLHVEHCMGTVFSIDVRDDGDWTEAIAEVMSWLHFVDATFSTYRADSDISRMSHGDLRVDDAHPLVTEVLELCVRASRLTGGWFTAQPRGHLDPTGLVKGWSIERASQILRAQGSANHAVNGGGDIQLAGGPAPGQPWVVGISDPRDRTRVVSTVRGRDYAVATSGVAERGDHIVDPFTGRNAIELASVTVIGPSLTDADAFATAAFAMGMSARAWLASIDGYEALLVQADGTRSVTGRAGRPRAAEAHR